MSRLAACCFILLLACTFTHASSFQTSSSGRTSISANTAYSSALLLRSSPPSAITKTLIIRPIQVRGGGAVGGGNASRTVKAAAPLAKSTTALNMAASATANKSKKKMRIAAFDSMRFFLIVNIVLGHFIRFASPSTFVFKLFSQHNVFVGAFFVLSGYVTAYTSTENGQRVASSKLTDTPKQKWILSRIFGYFPLYLLTLVLFAPVFLYADVHYNGWPTAALHGLLSLTMTQARFPMHAEIWNAPTWFLSALSFCTALMPYCLPSIATLDQTGLVKTGWWIFVVYMLPKIGYAYDFNTWKMAEGITAPKAYPNLAVFNMQRFTPVFAAAELLLGVIACRIVMLDKDDGAASKQSTALSTAWPLLTMAGLLYLRTTGSFEMNDLLFRGLLFVPLFLRFLMAVHRNTVTAIKDPLVKLLNNKYLIGLGNLSFPIFIVHGPIGQIFFKKIIAKQLWGEVLTGPKYFGMYLAATLTTAWLLQNTFLQSQAVKNWSKNTVDKLSSWM